jgi:nucleoside-diphosphate-sugar epimerase
MRKILLTGGSGFVGSHIVDVLITKKFSVNILDNSSLSSKKM